MEYIYLFLMILLLTLTILPKIQNPHWIFRFSEFGKIQITFFIFITLIIGFFININVINILYPQGLLMILLVYHSCTLIQYTSIYPVKRNYTHTRSSKEISFISANVYQFNKEYKRFIQLVKKYDPDIVLTMESNGDWEQSLREIEDQFPYQHKITLENTYGMHFYSKLEIKSAKTHYFVADDIPSMEINLKTTDGFSFVFFGVHPPPPSPTEEDTSKERDGDLLSTAQRIKELSEPIVTVGDFNNVAWSKSSILFRRTSNLIDPRIGRGFTSTFHAKYRFLRFPIDLMFHSKEIFVKKLMTLESFGSDHFPVYCSFRIDLNNNQQTEKIERADSEEKEEAKEMIKEGKEEEGNRDAIATED